MKQPSGDLHTLIHSMSPSEKRYFKLVAAPHSNLHSDNKYIRLFNFITKQQQYDETALKKHFSADSFLGKHLKKAKVHLYNLVLLTLTRYHEDERSEIHVLLHASRILHEKGLYLQSRKTLEKAKNLARKRDVFTALIDSMEQDLALVAVNREYAKETTAALLQEAGISLEKMNNLFRIISLQVNVFADFARFHSLSLTAQRRKLREAGRQLFHRKPKPLSRRAAILFYNTLGSYYHQLGSFEKSRGYFRKAVESSPPPNDESSVTNYIIVTSNYISACLGLKQYDEVSRQVNDLLNLGDKYPKNKRIRLVQCYMSHTVMSMYINIGDFSKGIDFLEKVKSKYFAQTIIRDKILFAFNSAVLYFGTGEFSRTVSFTGQIIRIPYMENPLPKTIYWSRVLQLLALWELQDVELLSYRVKSYSHFLPARQKLYAYEKDFLDFLRKLHLKSICPIDDRNTRIAFLRMKKRLDILLATAGEAHESPYFDILSWLESKIQNRPFAEIVREKNKE